MYPCTHPNHPMRERGGCMGEGWVFGCMDVWVWVYRCMRVWVGVGVVGVWMCVHMGVPVNCVCE